MSIIHFANTVAEEGEVTLSDHSSSVSGPGRQICVVTVESDGSLTISGTPTPPIAAEEWLEPKLPRIAQFYEVEAVRISGSNPPQIGTFDTYLPLTTNRQFGYDTIAVPGSSEGGTIELRIRRVGTPSPVATARMTLNATDTGGP